MSNALTWELVLRSRAPTMKRCTCSSQTMFERLSEEPLSASGRPPTVCMKLGRVELTGAEPSALLEIRIVKLTVSTYLTGPAAPEASRDAKAGASGDARPVKWLARLTASKQRSSSASTRGLQLAWDRRCS